MSIKKSRVRHGKLFESVKAELDGFDAYGLIEFGAPHDEFIFEAEEICAEINCDMTAAEIAQVIAEILNKNFEKVFCSSQFIEAAERIKDKF